MCMQCNQNRRIMTPNLSSVHSKSEVVRGFKSLLSFLVPLREYYRLCSQPLKHKAKVPWFNTFFKKKLKKFERSSQQILEMINGNSYNSKDLLDVLSPSYMPIVVLRELLFPWLNW